MQQSVPLAVLHGFSGVRAGRPSPWSLGLSVLLLFSPAMTNSRPEAAVADQRLRRSLAGPATLAWRETVPPHPGRVRAWNAASTAIVVDAGTALEGGMSLRAVRSTTVIPTTAEAIIDVEALGARWWDEGPLQWSGSVSPVVTALVLQAGLGEGAVASSARTAASSLSIFDIGTRAADPAHDDGPVGWALIDDEDVVAAWLGERNDSREGVAQAELLVPEKVASGSVVALVASVRAGINRGVLVAHAVDHDGCGRDLVVLPRGLQLVDRVVAATTGATCPTTAWPGRR